MYYVALLELAQNINFLHKKENWSGQNEREGKANQPDSCGLRIQPLIFPFRAIQVRGENFPNWVKESNGMFYYSFLTIYRKNFKFLGF